MISIKIILKSPSLLSEYCMWIHYHHHQQSSAVFPLFSCWNASAGKRIPDKRLWTVLFLPEPLFSPPTISVGRVQPCFYKSNEAQLWRRLLSAFSSRWIEHTILLIGRSQIHILTMKVLHKIPSKSGWATILRWNMATFSHHHKLFSLSHLKTSLT